MPACAVLLKMLYSLVAEVASVKALFASSCSHLTISRWVASVARTWDMRMPSMPKSLNSGDRAAKASASPISCSLPRNISTPSLVDLFSVSVNFWTSRPTVRASSWGFWKSIMMSLESADADISTFWPFASSVAANARISGIVILAWAPTPARRWANCTR